MPHFLDLFVNELREKHDVLRQTFTGEEVTDFDRQLKTVFQNHWRDLPSPKKKDLRVVAVDSGRSTREYAPGAFMYICRATALTSWGKPYRKITSHAHLITSPREQLSNMVSLRSEHVEHEVALEAIQDYSDVDVLLIDGSLYGRMLHVPISYNYQGERDLYLRFAETFNELLEECRKRKILLLGVSKDSVASHLTRRLLLELKQNILEMVAKDLSTEQMEQLTQYFDDIKKQSYSLSVLIRQLPLTKSQRALLRNLLYELKRPRPDVNLIHAWTETVGYTTPIEPYPDVPFYRYESKDPAAFVRRRFINVYDHLEDADIFEEWAIPIMRRVFQFPTFVTFCTKLAYNDIPLRIDLPAFNAGLPTRVTDLSESRLLDPPPKRVEEVLQMLQASYGGQDLYNVYLVRVDQEARLPKSDVTSLYEPLVEKELKTPLILKRRDRRVRYV